MLTMPTLPPRGRVDGSTRGLVWESMAKRRAARGVNGTPIPTILRTDLSAARARLEQARRATTCAERVNLAVTTVSELLIRETWDRARVGAGRDYKAPAEIVELGGQAEGLIAMCVKRGAVPERAAAPRRRRRKH